VDFGESLDVSLTAEGEVRVDFAETIHTDGGGNDAVTVRDAANSQDLARFNEGGPVEFPNSYIKTSEQIGIERSNGDVATINFSGGQVLFSHGSEGSIFAMDNGGNGGFELYRSLSFSSNNGGSSTQHILSPGDGTGGINVYDAANGQNLVHFNEGGPVEIPSVDLSLGGNEIANVKVISGDNGKFDFTSNHNVFLSKKRSADIRFVDNNADDIFRAVTSESSLEVPNGELRAEQTITTNRRIAV